MSLIGFTLAVGLASAAPPSTTAPTPTTPTTPTPPPTTTKAEPAKKTSTTAPSTTPTAPSTTTEPPLQQAEAALRAGVHKRCIELAQEALATGTLEEDGVARAWWTRGRCHSIDNDPDRAERSYAVAVRVKPTLLMPFDDAAWKKVAGEGTATDTALGLDAHTEVVPDGAVGVVAIAVVAHDDLALGRSFVVVDKDGVELARAPIERAEGATGEAWTVARHRFSGIPVEGASARLLDKHGNVLRRAAVAVDDASRQALAAAGAVPPATPAASTTSATLAAPSTLTYVGGGVVALGFASAAASAIALTTTQANAPTALDGQTPFLAGVGAGVAAIVVGAALVVVDQH